MKTVRRPDCHPERKYRAKGLCGPCYLLAWKAAHPGYMTKWRNANPDRVAEYQRAWGEYLKGDGADENRRKAREWAAANREKSRRKALQWQKDNPERARAGRVRHEARKRGATISDFTADEWQELLAEHEHRCFYCGSPDEIQRDHKIPLSRGGDHTKANIVPACRPCNQSKSAKTVEEFLALRAS